MLVRDKDSGKKRLLSGVIRAARYTGLFAKHQVINLELSAFDWVSSKRVNSRIFQNLSVPEIVSKVLADGSRPYECPPPDLSRLHGIRSSAAIDDAEKSQGYPKREYCVQYDESDLAFVTRLLQEEGLGLAYEQCEPEKSSDDPKDLRVMLFDTNEVLSPFDEDVLGVAPIGDGGNTTREIIRELTVAHEVTAMSTVVCDYDWLQPGLSPLHPACEETASDEDAKKRELLVSQPVSTLCGQAPKAGAATSAPVAKLRAELLLERERAQRYRLSGRGNILAFRPGTIFELDAPSSHEHADLDGRRFVITAVRHHGSTGGQNGAGDDTSYENTFDCLPIEVEYRPSNAGPRPIVCGPQTALVVGSKNEEVFTDEHGRIKVRFYWDRAHIINPHLPPEEHSCWIRVAQGWSGSGFGFMFIPRVGTEVVVSFIGGDPDRPLVTGCLYDGLNRPAQIHLPDDKTKSGIVTRSSKPGGAHGENHLLFEDAAGKEVVDLRAQKDLYIKTGNTRTTYIGKGARKAEPTPQPELPTVNLPEGFMPYEPIDPDVKDTQGKHDLTVVMGSQKLTVKQDRDVSVEGISRSLVQGDAREHVGGSRSRHVVGNEFVIVDGNVEQTVANDLKIMAVDGKIELMAEKEISLVMGRAKLTMDIAGNIKIEGANIMLDAAGTLIAKSDGVHTIKGQAVLINE